MSAITLAVLSHGIFASGAFTPPNPYDVRYGVDNGAGSLGTLTSPLEAQVLQGVQYGGDGDQYTGTLTVSYPGGVTDGNANNFLFDSNQAVTNNPLKAQQPAVPYLNDPGGFWAQALKNDKKNGLGSLLPANTFLQSDNQVKKRLLDAQIEWISVPMRWKGSVFRVSLSDSQFHLALESGGTTQEGRITCVAGKLQFGKGFPEYNDIVEIQANGRWHEFFIAELIGQFDDNEASLTIYLEIAQNDDGQ